MNKTMAAEELDRELILKHEKRKYGDDKIYDHMIKAKVTKTTFSLSDRFSGAKTLIFKKKSDGDISITVKHRTQIKQRCSLGHEHVIENKDDTYEFFEVPANSVDSFKEWIEQGTWREVMKRDTPEMKCLSDVREFLMQLKTENSLWKYPAQKMITKIDNVLEPWVERII